MWLLFSAVYMALLGLMDLLVDLIAINYYSVDAVTLGILSSLWILVYVVVSRMASRVAESKGSRYLMLASLGTIEVFIYTLLVLKGLHYLFISQVMHSLSVAFARSAVSNSILDNVESEEWNTVNKRYLQASLFLEGVIMYLVSWVTLHRLVADLTPWLFTVSGVIAASLFFLTPSSRFTFSRSLYRTEKSLNTSLESVSILNSFGYEPLYIPAKAKLFSQVWRSRVSLTLGDVLVSKSSFRLGNSYLFTPLTFILIKVLSLNNESILMIYGVSKLLATLALIALPDEFGRRLTSVALLLRLLAASLIISALLTRNYELILALTLIYLVNIMIDTRLYSMYIDASLASNPATYSIVSEASNFAGALTSGYILTLGGTPIMLVVMTMLTLATLRAPLKSES